MTTSNEKDKGLARFMAPLILSNMLNPLNSTMLATAVIAIVSHFHQDTGSGALLIVPLYFTSAIGQPLMGRLCDIFSAQKINLFGLLLIMLSGFLGFFAKDFNWLIASRIVLGLGSSAAYPSSITLIKRRYQALNVEVPGMALGLIAIAGQVSLAFGPFVGGVLLESFGWRGIFFVNVPLVLIGLGLSVGIKSEKEKRKHKSFRATMKDLDIVGLLLFSGFLYLFLLCLLYSTGLYMRIPAAVVLLISFVAYEMKHERPFIDIRVLSLNFLLNTTFLRQAFITFVLYLLLYGLPQWMEQSKGLSPSDVGLIMLPLSLTAMGISLLFSKSKKSTLLLLYGTICVMGVAVGLFTFSKASSIVQIVFITIIMGAGIGLLSIANQFTLYKEAPPGEVGVCFGLYRTVGYIGAILAGSSLKHQFSKSANDQGMHILGIYALGACLMIAVFMLPLFFKRRAVRVKVTI